VLAHLTSLPGGLRGGDLGPSAERFLTFLRRAGQSWWQMLPVGPPGYGNSPYSAQSAFAGSPFLVAMDPLVNAGLLDHSDAIARHSNATKTKGLPQKARARETCLREAFLAFEARPRKTREGLAAFRAENAHWLDDFALFRALKSSRGEAAWTTWPASLRARDAGTLASARLELSREVAYQEFVQYQFSEQWRALRAAAHAQGIGLIGDVPLYVAHDSADVWSRQSLFRLDEQGLPSKVAGVPPDYFSATGQRWGNPLYAWKRHQEDGFDWWTRRMRATLDRFDVVRLDHFIGFRRYWEIDASSPTAALGRWRPGPGTRLFKALSRTTAGGAVRGKSKLPFIAEDLGVVGADVLALRDRWKLPGTKVLQFAFGSDPSAGSFLPHNYPRRAVVYTGTHDNDTTVGWYEGQATGEPRSRSAVERERRAALRYLGAPDATDIHWAFMRAASASVASLAIFPLQDVLGLDSRARMNRPGTTDGNWTWRADASALTGTLADRLADLTRTYGRSPLESSS
jgi:4-alpha-glucanotransferase